MFINSLAQAQTEFNFDTTRAGTSSRYFQTFNCSPYRITKNEFGQFLEQGRQGRRTEGRSPTAWARMHEEFFLILDIKLFANFQIFKN